VKTRDQVRRAQQPTLDEVEVTLRRALHDPDPFERAAAAARLMLWHLPVAPSALVTIAERLVREPAAL
jgi:hypothetical protein